MTATTGIEWTDATWNPVRGCTRKSQGCVNCYAELLAARFSDPGLWGHGFAERMPRPGGGWEARWTGKLALASQRVLTWPLRWKGSKEAREEGRRPRIFVNSTSDLFHEALPDEAIDQVFAVMARAPQFDFQVLTKRADRMRAYVTTLPERLRALNCEPTFDFAAWPLPHVWLGVSVEDQATADERIPELLSTPAAVRFISAEPLIGQVDLTALPLPASWGSCDCPDATPTLNAIASTVYCEGCCEGPEPMSFRCLDWIIAGGESGAKARPPHPDWFRQLRDQCADEGVAFFFKQWGEWAPLAAFTTAEDPEADSDEAFRVGKHTAGAKLDGVLHRAFPEPHT